MVGLIVSLLAVVAVALVMRVLRTPAPQLPAAAALRGAPPDVSWQGRPRPGQVWLTTEVGRCLVVRTYPETVDVLPMPGERPEGTARLLPDAAFITLEGQADPQLWAEVQKAHRTGFAG